MSSTTEEVTTMADSGTELTQLSDDELIAEYRKLRTEAGGADPALSPPEENPESDVREEMDRRGLSPEREDVVPDLESPKREPIVEDRA